MSTLIINGSPNGKGGNTEYFINSFIKGAGKPYDTRYTRDDDPQRLAADTQGYDHILIFMPLYVHAMPGRVMKLLEYMPEGNGRKLGCLIQQGFVESSNSDYLVRYMKLYAKRMGYEYLGTVVKGNAAGVRYIPERMNKKLFAQLEELGRHYAETGKFHQATADELAKPHRLSKGKCNMYTITTKLGLNNIFWNRMMKKNNAFEMRADKPFVEV